MKNVLYIHTFAGYLMSARSADTCFGQVISCLKEEGLWEITHYRDDPWWLCLSSKFL